MKDPDLKGVWAPFEGSVRAKPSSSPYVQARDTEQRSRLYGEGFNAGQGSCTLHCSAHSERLLDEHYVLSPLGMPRSQQTLWVILWYLLCTSLANPPHGG